MNSLLPVYAEEFIAKGICVHCFIYLPTSGVCDCQH